MREIAIYAELECLIARENSRMAEADLPQLWILIMQLERGELLAYFSQKDSEES